MTLQDFKESTALEAPPKGLSPGLLALWYDRKGDWSSAHDTAQDIHTPVGSWIHAYLHRREGDLPNARYWYGRAAQPVCRDSLEDEWTQLADELLTQPVPGSDVSAGGRT